MFTIKHWHEEAGSDARQGTSVISITQIYLVFDNTRWARVLLKFYVCSMYYLVFFDGHHTRWSIS